MNKSFSFQDYSEGEFDWDPAQQGLILGSFFYGYVLTQLPGGYLAETYGGKWIVAGGMTLASLMNFTFPAAAKTSTTLFIVLRSVQGMGEGFSFVGLYALSAKWIPRPEKGRLLTFVLAGSQVGFILALPLCGVMADTLGWESVFYFSGGMSAVIVTAWVLLVSSCPESHPRISASERAYIEHHTVKGGRSEKLPFPPFKHIITSPAVLSMIFCQMGIAWGGYLLMTGIPTYLDNIQHYEIKTVSPIRTSCS